MIANSALMIVTSKFYILCKTVSSHQDLQNRNNYSKALICIQTTLMLMYSFSFV